MFGELIGAVGRAVWDGDGASGPRAAHRARAGTRHADRRRAARRAGAARLPRRGRACISSRRARCCGPSNGRPCKARRSRSPGTRSSATCRTARRSSVANEFFDALPIRQYVRTERGWCERLVGLGRRRPGLRPCRRAGPRLDAPAPAGTVLEVPAAGIALDAALADRLVAAGGAALIVDYGAARGGARRHPAGGARATPSPTRSLEPGEADLTAHVDFGALARPPGGEAPRCTGR